MKQLFTQSRRLEFVAFWTGFALMAFELAAARILAPSVGSSTYVWTSVIGVIIAALSLGYWAGGKLADARKSALDVVWLCLLAGFLILCVLLVYVPVLDWTTEVFNDARLQGMLASLILFAPTSLVLGAISPYLAKLNVTSLKSSGTSIANLSALNSVGGIAGTFATGFIIFGFIGSRETLGLLALMLLAISWVLVPRTKWQARAGVSVGLLIVGMIPGQAASGIQIDTPSAHYMIYTAPHYETGRTVRALTTGPTGAQSGIYPDHPDELVFWYAQQMAKVVEEHEQRDNILVLGGGTFTLPEYLAKKYPDSNVDTVEIDPKLEGIAKQYFDYESPENSHLIFEDARSFVNQTDTQYDIILADIYADTSVPFSLMTREYGQQIKRALKPGGVIVANLIAGIEGDCRNLLGALDAPYREAIPNATYVLQRDQARTNLIVVYSNESVEWNDAAKILPQFQPRAYADNFAPAERLHQACLDQSKRETAL